MRFDFEFDPRFATALRRVGLRPDTCWIEVNGLALDIRFGPWRVATPRTNVVSASVDGPYRWWKVIGPHLSLADLGLTLGTGDRRGVCILLRTPVRGIEPFGLVRHRGVTVTAADPEGLVRALLGPSPGQGNTGTGT